MLASPADLLREVQRPGKLLAGVAEGYTDFIQKEGLPGPLNTRLLTVLSIVYRHWAGVPLADAIACHESSAHPVAFCFRPATSALDGATVTKVLLELCRLRGWAVTRMSIDYLKYFHLMPQAVVLALALELRIDPGTCRALGGMYKQLGRAFKIAGALGLWWQGTNGKLQRCPLSVILVNGLTTIWKWEVDSLHRQVWARTAAPPPPVLDVEAADDLEPGDPLPIKNAGTGCAVLGSSGYADVTEAVVICRSTQLHHPCGLGGPLPLGMATLPLPSSGPHGVGIYQYNYMTPAFLKSL